MRGGGRFRRWSNARPSFTEDIFFAVRAWERETVMVVQRRESSATKRDIGRWVVVVRVDASWEMVEAGKTRILHASL